MIKKGTRLSAFALAFSVLLLSLTSPLSAQDKQEDETGYTIQVVQLDTSGFPEIDVWVSVTDAKGNPVTTLPDSAFTLIENGQPAEIQEVHQAGEQGPVTTVLAIDRSGSMNDYDKLDAAKAAATAFVDLMRPEDSAGVIVFNTQVEVVQEITSDKELLRDAIAALRAFDDTAMYDALEASIGLLGGVSGRRAIILLSDGLDNRSQLTADDILGGVEQAELSIYTIGLGDPAQESWSTAAVNEEALKSVAERSRGTYRYAPEPEGLSELYQQLSSRLQNEYRLNYTSPSTLHDGVRRGLEVRVAETGDVQADYNPGGVIPETTQALSWPIFGGLMAGLVALLLVPDVVRVASKRWQGARKRRKKSRVKLTGAGSTGKEPADSKATESRVRLGEKGD